MGGIHGWPVYVSVRQQSPPLLRLPRKKKEGIVPKFEVAWEPLGEDAGRVFGDGSLGLGGEELNGAGSRLWNQDSCCFSPFLWKGSNLGPGAMDSVSRLRFPINLTLLLPSLLGHFKHPDKGRSSTSETPHFYFHVRKSFAC